ncbi:hypothetical protein P153DRAFT_390899 [Dothidotthia symphoricarpi CBS 119687]|uniref:Uncharacterized protein n=1 Tax=Dothidotthia symphoricarpi CBS 119687 TaxID=1392245 RepID=A0A6A5ZW85_9PLEO|nr:uncharacterized protein P153DRAFT_390899 [Dothidotthia symphoricarpi CBS 119687]KAF2123850.1 hypothetical protein P153DRAFT_390899 [Dothidotthia symphoricarpi CBS 119687]
MTKSTTEKTGYEAASQVNVLSTLFFAMLVLPTLKHNAAKCSFADKYITPADAEIKVGQTLVEVPWYLAMPTKLMQVFVGRTVEQGGRELVSATLLGKIGHT